METASTYFTRRARQERTSALDAVSAEARSAHLEMAFRLVLVATTPVSRDPWLKRGLSIPRGHNDNAADEVRIALRDAFPVPVDDDFQRLLDAVDHTYPRG